MLSTLEELMDIEKIATSAVKTTISRTNRLKAFIPDEDKEPCWDGHIYIYDNDKYSKHNIRRVAAQIKGKQTKSKTLKNTIKYGIDSNDLNAYLIDGGVLFFVVYIDEQTGDCLQIYYVALSPIKIHGILNNKKQKKHSVMLKKYPQKKEEQEAISIRFWHECERQAGFGGRKLPSLEKLKNDGVLESVSMHIVGNNINSAINSNTLPFIVPKLMENNELTLYANVRGGIGPIPVEYYESVNSVTTSQTIYQGVGVGSTEFYSSYEVLASTKQLVYSLGTCVMVKTQNTLTVENTNTPIEISIDMKIRGRLSERIKGIEFIISILNEESLYIGKTILKKCKWNSDKHIAIEDFSHTLSSYRKFSSVLEMMHIKDDPDFNKFDDNDYDNLNLITAAIGEKHPLLPKKRDRLSVQFIRISNISIAVIYDEINGLHYMFDYYGEGYQLYNKENNSRIPRFWNLTADIINRSSNLNLDVVILDYTSMPQTEDVFYNGNDIMLEMLKAYDIKNSEEVLDATRRMIDWLDTKPSYLDEETRTINRLQVEKRVRPLTFEEKDILHTIIHKTSNNQNAIGALLLLDEQEEAEKYLKLLTPNEKEFLQSSPIYFFHRTNRIN